VPDLSDKETPADFIALSLLPTWCWLRAAEELRAGAGPSAALEHELEQHFADKPDTRAELRRRTIDALDRAQSNRLAPVCWPAASYPVALRTIFDPPPVLWTRGASSALNAPAVAIVGARAASAYGLAVAARLAADLAAAGLVVVSGMARGVDSAAHRGALSVQGVTVAVLGSGADIIYPAENRLLARDIAASGAVISELVPGTPPLPHFFPLRNRIISGLARAVVVIEAGEKSGSLITARTRC
jgi:DNA processing protein